MALTSTEKLDLTNIGLMLVSGIVAMILPFEVFLFSYAILGPLHYFTEISWLHDRKYYTKERYDAIILLIIGLIITLRFFDNFIEIDFPPGFDANLSYVALLCSIVFVTVKNKFYRIGGIVLLVFSSQVSHHFYLFFSVFLPTLIHVYVFTALFMLYGALKSNSRFGIISVICLVVCPILLAVIYPDTTFYAATDYSREAYTPFKSLNINWLKRFNGVSEQETMAAWDNIIFNTSQGIVLMRFIAFAYTYHYLNWFSKTSIIQWHKVPKGRFVAVIILWLISITIYIYNYTMGLQWLLFVSFLHVLLEFPLNITSIIGIGNYFKGRLFKTSSAPAQ